jgi:hypothetical protein
VSFNDWNATNAYVLVHKAVGRIDEMMRLVERFHSEHVDETHKRLAEDLEQRGEYKAAEEQYILAEDWASGKILKTR